MTAHPVLVVHGVGNRGDDDPATSDGESAHEMRVEKIQRRVGPALRLIPVYWGDLAADPRYFEATLPPSEYVTVRADSRSAHGDVEVLSLLSTPTVAVRDGPPIDIVTKAAVGHTGGAQVTRSRPSDAESAIANAIKESWTELSFIHSIDDPTILEAVGSAVRAALHETDPTPTASSDGREFATRASTEHVRGVPLNVTEFVRGVLRGIDHALGATIGEIGGRLNNALRETVGPGVIGFFGDIIAYLDKRETTFRGRIRAVIEEEAPGYGSADRPIGAIGHSLGGVILFDVAVGEDPLHYSSLVTFGSQAPFFHAISRRSKRIDCFDGNGRVRLTPQIGRWINLWEPLDVVAFLASQVFELSDGSQVDDRKVEYELGSGLWTHSSYWERPELVTAIRDAFDGV